MRNLLYFIFFSLLVIPGFSQMPKKAATARLNGIDLYYETYGQGEPLFLLHGWTQSSQSWREHIATYAAHFEVYAIDLRGHGNTSPLTEEFSIQKAANDIVALMDHLKFDKIKAVGLSYGGILLLQISSQHPNKITSKVLIGAAYNYSGSDNQELNETFAYYFSRSMVNCTSLARASLYTESEK